MYIFTNRVLEVTVRLWFYRKKRQKWHFAKIYRQAHNEYDDLKIMI